MDDTSELIFTFFLINGVLSLLVSSFFTDRKIGMWGVFGISLILSPLIGLIVGLSSEKVKSGNTTNSGKRQQLLKQIELMSKEGELGLLDEEGKQRLEQLKVDYISLNKNEPPIRSTTSVEQKKENLERLNRQMYYTILFVVIFFIILFVVTRV